MDHESEWITANLVPRKEQDLYAIQEVVEEIKGSRYNRMIVQSDQEPVLLDLLRPARRERAGTIQSPPEEGAVEEHQSNGKTEASVQIMEGQITTMKMTLGKRSSQHWRKSSPAAIVNRLRRTNL